MVRKNRKKGKSAPIVPNTEKDVKTLQEDTQTNQREELRGNTGAIPKIPSVEAAGNSTKTHRKRNRKKTQVTEEAPLQFEAPNEEFLEIWDRIISDSKGNGDEASPQRISEAGEFLNNIGFSRRLMELSLDAKEKPCFSIGETVWESTPFVYIMAQKENVFRCERCLFMRENLRPCENCHYVFYCSQECEEALKNLHKFECEKLRNLGTEKIRDLDRFLGLIIMVLKDPKFRKVFDQLDHIDKSDIELYGEGLYHNKELFQAFGYLQKYLGEEDMATLSEYKTIYAKTMCDSINIFSGIGSSIGMGLYPGSSFFKHSCSPNACISFVGPILRITSINEIPVKGIYGVTFDKFKVVVDRKFKEEWFQKLYNVRCQCIHCTDAVFYQLSEAAINKELAEELQPKIDGMMTKILSSQPKTKEDLDAQSEDCEIAMRLISSVYTDFNLKLLRLLQHYGKYIFMGGMNSRTRSINEKSLNMHEFYFGHTHPFVANIAFRLAYAFMSCKQEDRAKHYMVKGIKIIGAAFGIDHPFYIYMNSVLQYCSEKQWRFGKIISRHPYSFDDY